MPLFVIRTTHHHHHHGTGGTLALENLLRSAIGVLNQLTGKIEAMRTEVQALVTEVTNLKNSKEASDRAWDIMTGQLDEAKNKVAALQQQVAAGGVDPDDVAALSQMVTDIHQVASSMKGAVPANTEQAPAGGGTETTGGQQG